MFFWPIIGLVAQKIRKMRSRVRVYYLRLVFFLSNESGQVLVVWPGFRWLGGARFREVKSVPDDQTRACLKSYRGPGPGTEGLGVGRVSCF